MEPKRAAERTREEIEAWLDEWEDGGLVLQSLEAPPHLGADTHFTLTFNNPRTRESRVVHLPTGLALGYLADEEAAVDEWKNWLHSVLTDLS